MNANHVIQRHVQAVIEQLENVQLVSVGMDMMKVKERVQNVQMDMLQMEERLEEFKYIISSANTAYENGTISKARLEEIFK